MNAIASLEARRQQVEAKYHDIHCPDDTRSEEKSPFMKNAHANIERLLYFANCLKF